MMVLKIKQLKLMKNLKNMAYENEPHVFEVSFYDREKSMDYNNYVINKFKEIIED